VVSFLRKLARESGVEICSGHLDLLSSSSGELAALPTCRHSTPFLPAAGWVGRRSFRGFPISEASAAPSLRGVLPLIS
jgi:hypothetical protein